MTCAVRALERNAAAERGEAAIRQLEAGRRSARLAVLPDGLAVGLEQDGRAGLAHGDVDRAEHRAVHAAERLEVRAGIEHGDDDGQSELAGLGFAAPSMTACAWWEVTCMTFS